MQADKAQDALPYIGGGVSVFVESPVKETVGCAGIENDQVRRARSIQLVVQRLHIAFRNPLIGPAQETEDWITHGHHHFQRNALAARPGL